MSALDDLAAELGISSEQLRARLLSTEDEALQASYLTTDAQGRVSAQFSGHIQASGLDMIANQSLTYAPPATSVIHWHKDSQTGAVVAELQGAGSSPADTPGLFVRSIAPDDAHTAQTTLEASYTNPGVDPTSGARVNINKKASAGPANPDQTYVSAEAWYLDALHAQNGAQVRIIGADGASDFAFKNQFIVAVNAQPLNGLPSTPYVFNLPRAGNYLALFMCSCYSPGGGLVKVGTGIDGFQVQCMKYFNEINSHQALVPVVGGYTLTAGNHSVQFRNDANATADTNDFGTVLLVATA